jgi:5-formyltetrahydrofolate cyclo-ligase
MAESAIPQQKVSIMDMLALESVEEFHSLEPDKWGIPSLKKAQITNKRNCFGGQGISLSRASLPEDQTTRNHGLDLIVMPGMAFDPGLRRLGHGKGYYDHFLTRYSQQQANDKTATQRMPFLGEKTPELPGKARSM